MSGQSSESGEQYNRVFCLGGKDLSKQDFQDKFGEFGEVKDVWMVEDRKTGEFKGVTYITFSKASEAALAIEELNGKTLPNVHKPLKVLLANDKREGNVRDPKEGERMMRLFIIVPKSLSSDDIKKQFEEYGNVEYVRLIKDRKSGTSKGLAYVKYYRAYHAAVALEKCDSSFKAVFAAPKTDQPATKSEGRWEDYNSYCNSQSGSHSDGLRGSYGGDSYRGSSGPALLGSGPGMSNPPMATSPLQTLLKNFPTDGGLALEVMAAPGVTRDQLYSLLDMTPGLEYCELDKESGIAYVQYKAAQCAAYAKEKLTYIEFPPGFRIAVRYPQAQNNYNSGYRFGEGGAGNSSGSGPSDGRSMRDQGWSSGGPVPMETSRSGGMTASLQDATASLTSSLAMADGNMPDNIETLVESIKKATDLIQRTAGGGGGGSSGGAPPSGPPLGPSEERVRFCNVPLPLTKPFASRETSCSERLFVVAQPDSFSQEYLQDALCRFGGLIDAFFMPGKNFGYAKFSSVESAEHAIRVLHGQQVCGMRMKVMKADPPKYADDKDSRGDPKRARTS